MTTTISSSRINQLDAVRGMAILGIFLMNIFAFALPQAAYLNPYYSETTPTSDAYIWVVFNLLFQGKVLSIFSILFGATLALLQSKDLCWNRYRLVVLALFGMIHGVLFWDGDILLAYALTGLLVIYLLNQYGDSALFKIAISLYMIGLAILLVLGSGVDPSGFWQVSSEQAGAEYTIKTSEGVSAVFYRASKMLSMLEMLVIQYGWQLSALMLFGVRLMKNGWLRGQYSSLHYRKIALLFIAPSIFVQTVSLYVQNQLGWPYFSTAIVGYIINEMVIPFQSLGYIALIYGFWGEIQQSKVINWLQKVGRMALSNYILQTLICSTLFYHLGYFGRFTRLELLLFIPFVWAINLIFSYYWLRIYQQGPVEMCWRKLAEKLSN